MDTFNLALARIHSGSVPRHPEHGALELSDDMKSAILKPFKPVIPPEFDTLDQLRRGMSQTVNLAGISEDGREAILLVQRYDRYSATHIFRIRKAYIHAAQTADGIAASFVSPDKLTRQSKKGCSPHGLILESLIWRWGFRTTSHVQTILEAQQATPCRSAAMILMRKRSCPGGYRPIVGQLTSWKLNDRYTVQADSIVYAAQGGRDCYAVNPRIIDTWNQEPPVPPAQGEGMYRCILSRQHEPSFDPYSEQEGVRP